MTNTMFKYALAALFAIALTTQAAARRANSGQITCNQQSCSDQAITEAQEGPRHVSRHHGPSKSSQRTASPIASGGSGIVRSRKTGATARVSPRFAPIAQAVVDDLENNHGASIRFMGGYRKGPCWSGGLHPCGLAIDLCQTARGVVDRRCNLPSRSVEALVAAAHGALSGGVWCNQDRGHIQLGQTAGACGSNLYASVGEFQARKRHARHHHRRYASR